VPPGPFSPPPALDTPLPFTQLVGPLGPWPVFWCILVDTWNNLITRRGDPLLGGTHNHYLSPCRSPSLHWGPVGVAGLVGLQKLRLTDIWGGATVTLPPRLDKSNWPPSGHNTGATIPGNLPYGLV